MPNYRVLFEKEWKINFENRRRKLNPLFRLYLNIRRNYVHDILFKHSLEHLKAMVAQFKEGRTNIRTQIELGIMIETKKQWVDTKLEELTAMRDAGDISSEQLKEYREWR